MVPDHYVHTYSDKIFEDVMSRIEARFPSHQRPLFFRSDIVRDMILTDIERHLRDLLEKSRLPAAAGAS